MFGDNANELRFKNSSDEVRFLAVQNHMLMQRLTIAEADIAELKQDYKSLKATVVSSTAESEKSKTETTARDKTMKLNMMSSNMVS